MKTTTLYEWLARWRDGALSGWHVQLLTTHTDDVTGEVLAQKISDAMTPAQAEAAGFALTDILEQLHVGALTLCEQKDAALAAKGAELQIAADTISARDAEIASLREQLALEPLPGDPLGRALAALDTEWTRRKDAGFMFADKLIDSDPVSRENIANAAVTALICLSTGQPFSLEPAQGWKCADNTYIQLDAQAMLGMQATMVQAGVALFAHAQALKAQIASADDPASIDVTAGWPQI